MMGAVRHVTVWKDGKEIAVKRVSLFHYRAQNNFKFTVTDNCDPNPCKEDGVCTNMLNDFSCDCIFGLEGKDCSESMLYKIRL